MSCPIPRSNAPGKPRSGKDPRQKPRRDGRVGQAPQGQARGRRRWTPSTMLAAILSVPSSETYWRAWAVRSAELEKVPSARPGKLEGTCWRNFWIFSRVAATQPAMWARRSMAADPKRNFNLLGRNRRHYSIWTIHCGERPKLGSKARWRRGTGATVSPNGTRCRSCSTRESEETKFGEGSFARPSASSIWRKWFLSPRRSVNVARPTVQAATRSCTTGQRWLLRSSCRRSSWRNWLGARP
mmetsp:Transcript_109267/g.308275  ORF Transcript_109267/g.308275 Transcript_109267/m.308275 type:complete len:241 (-) Transcript_109267:321-1043(-)